MSDKSIIMRPKKWFRISNYIASVVGAILFCYILYQVFFSQPEDPAFVLFILAAVSIVGLLSVLITIPNIHRFKIELHSDGIIKQGIMTREIKFEEIDKLVIRKGGIEVHGHSFLSTISFGDLHENFEKASDFLADRIASDNQIEIKGNDKSVKLFMQNNQPN